ncbi:hypothetical protein SEA_PHINKY_33 [Microbacterium phage Phinky]|nr:hypothetical protein SEA_PHINKY_33 [Microbacterium phage Phinky]
MAPITPPEGTVFVPRKKGANRAAELLEAAKEVGADRFASVRTTTNGYHVFAEVAEQDQKNHPEHYEVEDADAVDATEDTEDENTEDENSNDENSNDENSDEDDKSEELEPLPVTAESSNKEIDAYAAEQDPAVDLSSASNRVEKIALLEAARAPKNDDTAE